jgi:hypothetical protein
MIDCDERPGHPPDRTLCGDRRSCGSGATTVLADKGLAGRAIERQLADMGVTLLRPDRRDEPARHGNLGGVRQWIESIFDTLKGQLGLERHGARTTQGVGTRIAQRLLALAAAVWHNWNTHAPSKRRLIAYDH